MTIREKLNSWQGWLVLITGIGTTLVLLVNWARAGYDVVHWQHEADSMKIELAQAHATDMSAVYSLLSEEKRADRVQRNAREYARLRLKYENEEWQTVGGKDLMIRQISALELALCKDSNDYEKKVDPVISTIVCVE